MTSQELKDFRKSLNMTQAEMAILCGVALVTYKTWEYREVSKLTRRFLHLLRIPENMDLMMNMALDDSKANQEKVSPLSDQDQGTSSTKPTRKLL